MRLRFGLIGLALAAGAVLAAACGGGSDDSSMNDMSAGGDAPMTVAGADLTVNLTYWAMEPSGKEVSAGMLKIAAVHKMDHAANAKDGGAMHQLVLAKLEPGAKAGEGKFGKLALNLTDIKMGETKTGEVNLEPGTYELACLMVEEAGGKTYNHYDKGMFTTLTVR